MPLCRNSSKSNIRIVERCKIDAPAQIHDHLFSMLDTGTSLKSDGVKLLLIAPI